MAIRLAIGTLFVLSLNSVALADIAFPPDTPWTAGFGIAAVIGGLAITIAIVLGGVMLFRKRTSQQRDEK
jgi:Ca2+/Na+ antiporter